MILTGCPRDNSMYPRTDRCDDRMANVCSSSAGIGIVVADDVGATLECDSNDVLVDVVAAYIAIGSTSSYEFGQDGPFLRMRAAERSA